MRLVTYSFRGTTRLGAMRADNEVIDLARASALNGEAVPHDMMALLALGDAGLDAARRALAAGDQHARGNRASAIAHGIVFQTNEPGFRLEAPVMKPGKVLAIGLNYRDHAEEAGMKIPERPVVFTKVPSCITGPGMPIHRPRVSSSVDWEAELCAIIGTRARHVKAAEALRYVAGLACGNDVSVRDWQFHSGTWMMGKGFDTHGPLGPWLVTLDEVGDPANLDIRTLVNGVEKQHSNTRHLIFNIGQIIEYLTAAFTLEPGDVIFTGTPAGVGASRKPQEWLKAGDTVRVEISKLGALENPVIEEPES
ncbi:MAG TPA: fumarylacetoacetate hydrolase family protein [Candidatus Binataceae bacterium]|nr:fumarylacetoacetate hydrolase family protein [Candidatus Binataceae bacterium]